MPFPMIMILSSSLLSAVPTAHAENLLDCRRRSLAEAVNDPPKNGRPIRFTGVCAGPIVIKADTLTLVGVGTAIIDGGGRDALIVVGASNVSLRNFEVRNGRNGVVAINGAHVTLKRINSHDNLASGISLQTGSSAIVTGTLTASNNGAFGINVSGSAITFSEATVSADSNALGVQLSTGASAFINDSATVINVDDNLSTGLAVVSGAHLVAFGGTINASGNPLRGVSVKSKGGLDLDAASTLNSFGNGDGVVLEEASVMTVFNTPQVSGVPGFSTVNTQNNTGTGVRVLSGSVLTLQNQARAVSIQNARGLVADDGIGLTLVNSTITGNTLSDIQLTFGTRADLRTLVFGTYTCDATVLVRGTSGIVCPH